MTQEERLDILIAYLMNEQPLKKIQGSQRYIQSKFDIFAALASQREPKEVPKKILSLQDDYLKEKIKEAGIITINQTQQISDRIFLYKGNLHQLQVQAIVLQAQPKSNNTPNKHGTPSEKSYTMAGIQLRQENEIALEDFINNSASKITRAYNLPSQNIIHINPSFSNKQTKEETLKTCYKSCLILAKTKGIKTIAFPSIGTPEKTFNQQEAAKIALEIANEFNEQNKECKIIFALSKSSEYNIYKEISDLNNQKT